MAAIFKTTFLHIYSLHGNCCFPNKISLKYSPWVLLDNKPVLTDNGLVPKSKNHCSGTAISNIASAWMVVSYLKWLLIKSPAPRLFGWTPKRPQLSRDSVHHFAFLIKSSNQHNAFEINNYLTNVLKKLDICPNLKYCICSTCLRPKWSVCKLL